MAKTTDIPSGANSAPPTPPRNMIGTNTMQIDRVATNAGVATSAAPSRMACLRGLPRSIWRWLFSISTVASSTRMPTASANPPSVITFSDWCRILSMMMEVRIDRGIDVMTINVLRQEARNSRIISVLDPVDSRGECPLTYGDDPILHLGRGQPGVGPDDVD